MRTITASSKHFTCMTTFGHKIAAACDDGTVGVYDSVTGVLRLSLRPVSSVQAIGGSPDSSILFCAHKTPSITVWDMQTGGLIHTFDLDWNPEDIAVSLKGRYLACELSDGSVDVWEVANKMGDAVIGISSPVTHFCWLEPEERLAVSKWACVQVWDIVTKTFLYEFAVHHQTHRMVYSQKFNQLAIMASFTLRSEITFLDPQANKFIDSQHIDESLSCFTFSQTTKELVCCVDPHDPSAAQGARLRLFNVRTQRWRSIEYPDTMTYISSLPNGTVVANSVGSGIQLLGLDQGDITPSRRPDISTSTVHAFDQGKIMTIIPTSRDHIVLLEPVTVSQLIAIPVRNTSHPTHILCASLENHVAVYCFEEVDREYMQLWRLHSGDLKWTVEIGGPPSIGRISPSGTQLVTFHDVDNQTCICVRDAQNGQLKAQLQTDLMHPLDITFDSETRFYSHHDAYRIPFVVSPFKSEGRPQSVRDILHVVNIAFLATLTHSITQCGRLLLIGGPQKRHYEVDETREWVVSDSKRICWIPPGYIGSAQPSYCWAGHSLVMAGQDGTLRKLMFQEPN